MPESSATTLDELWVKFNAKFENIERGLKEMQTQGKKTDSIWKSIGNTVKTVFSFFAVQRVVQWFRSLIGMGTESAREMRQVDAALAALGDRFVKMRPLIDEHAQRMIALGFDDEETARSMAHLLGVTRDWNTALEINAVAMDLAAYKSISLEAATQALSRAWAGNTRMLREFGIDVREGARGMEVLRTVAARVQGQAAASVDPLKVMGIMLRNMGEDVGKRLLPVVYNLFQAFNRLWPSIGPIIEQLAGVFGQLLNAVGPLVESLGQGLVTALRGAAPLINVIVGFIGQLVQLLAPYLPMIAQFIGQTLQRLAPILQIVADAISQILAAVLPLLPRILQFASALETVAMVLGTMLVAQAIGSFLTTVPALVAGFISWASSAASAAAATITATAPLVGIGAAIMAAVAAVVALAMSWKELWNLAKTVWKAINDIITSYVRNWSKIFQALGNLILGALTFDKKRIQKGLDGLKEAFTGFAGDVSSSVSKVADAAGETFSAIWDNLKKEASWAGKFFSGLLPKGRMGEVKAEQYTWTPPAAPAGPEAAAGGGTVEDTRNEALEKYLRQLDHEIAMEQVSLEQQRERLQEALKLTKTQDERWQIEERLYALDKQIAELPYEKRRRELDHRVAMGELTLQQQLEELKNLRELATTEEERWRLDEEIYALEQKIAALPYEERMRELDHRVAMGELTLEQQREELQNLLKLNLTEEQRWQIEEQIYALDKQIAELPYEKRRRELDHRVAMGELTLQQQLEELKNLRDLATTDEQRWLIDEEIYELEQKIAALPYEERMRELDHRVAMGELTLEQQREELQNLLKLNLTEEQRWQIEERIYQINEQLAEQAREQAEEARQQTEQLKQSWSSFLQDWIKGGFKMSDIWDRIMARLLDKFIDTLVEMIAASDKYGLLQALGDLLGLGVNLGGETPRATPGFGELRAIEAGMYQHGGIVPSPVAVAARGMVVPQTRKVVPALLHEREMVLPRQLSEGLQRLIASGGGGDTFNVTIQAVDAPSIVRLFSRPEVRGPVLKHVRDELRQKGRI